MKEKTLSIIIFALLSCLTATAQAPSVAARIITASDSIPVEYATVKLMQPDSTMIASALTDRRGEFSFDTPFEAGMYLAISSVGCRSINVSLPCDSVIRLASSNRLSEVVVRSSKRFVKGTARGLQISMNGNPIAKLGSAMEALKQLPLIDSSNGGISVLGHGSPLIYINNRRLRSTSELLILSAEHISDVEIITNPSSRYGSDVNSVILIRTKQLNAGFHVVASGNVSVSEVCSGTGYLTLNHHTAGGLTLFGDFSYGSSGFRQDRHYSETFSTEGNPDRLYNTDTYSRAKSRSQTLMADAGFNYDFGRNSFGVKYTFRRTPRSHYTADALTTTDYGHPDGSIEATSDLFTQSFMHHVNTFGFFNLPAKIGLRIDADFVRSSNNSKSGVDENASENIVANANSSDGTLWSGELVLSRRFSNLAIEAGTDISYTDNKQDYAGFATGNQDFINPETDHVKQNLYAAFIGFEWSPNVKWNIYGGLRLETTKTDFRQNNTLRADLSKTYTDWMPNFGISFNSPVNLSLYYRASVARPGYRSLDNTYVYVTPTLWETGNAELQACYCHRIGLNLYYQKFMLQSAFNMFRHNVASIYRHEDTEGINVVMPVNLPDYNSFQLTAVQQLDFGLWHPTLQGVVSFQNLEYGTPKRKYNKPVYTLSLNNRFDIPGGFYAYLNIMGYGTGNDGVVYSRGMWMTSITLNKRLRNWTFTLSANDIFNTWRQRFDTFTNTVDYTSSRKGASRSVSLNIRYTLNTAKGKYKGKPSRQDEIDRL